jgi:hypothetical protein
MIFMFILPMVPIAFYLIVSIGAEAVWSAVKAVRDAL